MNGLPLQIKAEIKFSTGRVITVPEREWKALQPEAEQGVGVIAVLSLVGDLELDGQWILIDPTQAFRSTKAGGVSIATRELARIAERQIHLHPLREALVPAWRSFLHGYLERAIGSRSVLQRELKRRHTAGKLAECLSDDHILDCDHLENVRQVVQVHGEGVAGGIFQDLFAYLLGYLGYANIVCNTIGVPDVTASALAGIASFDPCSFNAGEMERIAEVCEKAGELKLAARLRRARTGNQDLPPVPERHSQMPREDDIL